MRTQLLIGMILAQLCSCVAPDDPGMWNNGSDWFDGTHGELGELVFSYEGEQCLFFGCTLDRAVLAGIDQELEVGSLERDVAWRIYTTPQGVAEVADWWEAYDCYDRPKDQPCGRDVAISTLAPGLTTLVVASPSGDIVDQVKVLVKSAASFEPPSGSPLVMNPGGSIDIAFLAFADDGAELLLGRGMWIEVSDPSVALLTTTSWLDLGFEPDERQEVQDTVVEVHAKASGSATIAARTALAVEVTRELTVR